MILFTCYWGWVVTGVMAGITHLTCSHFTLFSLASSPHHHWHPHSCSVSRSALRARRTRTFTPVLCGYKRSCSVLERREEDTWPGHRSSWTPDSGHWWPKQTWRASQSKRNEQLKSGGGLAPVIRGPDDEAGSWGRGWVSASDQAEDWASEWAEPRASLPPQPPSSAEALPSSSASDSNHHSLAELTKHQHRKCKLRSNCRERERARDHLDLGATIALLYPQ